MYTLHSHGGSVGVGVPCWCWKGWVLAGEVFGWGWVASYTVECIALELCIEGLELHNRRLGLKVDQVCSAALDFFEGVATVLT